MLATTLDTASIWKRMGEERRKQAALAFYNDETTREFQRAADGFIARQRNFRPQFVKRLPPEKRAQYLATLPLPIDVAAQLIIAFHFSRQRPMMADFLNALGVQNEQGMIAETAAMKAPSAEKLQEAVSSIKAKYPAEDVEIYLETLFVQNPEVWGGLESLLEK